MTRSAVFILFFLLLTSCSLKNFRNTLPSVSDDRKKEDHFSFAQVEAQDRNTFPQPEISVLNVSQNRVENSVDTCGNEKEKRRFVFKPVHHCIQQRRASESGQGIDPNDHHVLFILFYFCLGLIFILWGGSLLLVGIFAASFFGAMLGLFVLVLGLIPMIGIVTMLYDHPHHRPDYSEE